VKINTHVQPLVITSTGLLDKEFVQWLYAAATTGSVRGFANHAIASIQVAVLNQQARSLDHLSERIARLESARSKVLVDGASTALEKDIVVDSDEEEDPTVHLNEDGDLAVSQHVPEVDGGGGGGLSVDSGDGVGARVYSGHDGHDTGRRGDVRSATASHAGATSAAAGPGVEHSNMLATPNGVSPGP
jgi:hypothetical protein